ncbi:hypothetical protein [Neosynechococcus sphagnicola]|uniref:hypothetical protein n=1 Tax=Neosynechococcus sphagnicola TaxID=1501145 RepID=UPI00308439EB
MSRSRALQAYILLRLLLAPLMLWTITTVVFLLLRATPGDPVDAILGPRAPAAAKAALARTIGVGCPPVAAVLQVFWGFVALGSGHLPNQSGAISLGHYSAVFPRNPRTGGL